MTRNVMFCFLQNLTTSKKHQQQQQLQASSTSKKISDSTLFGVSKSKSATKSKKKCEIEKVDSTIYKSPILNEKTKKKTTSRSKFFLRKSRSTNSVSLGIQSASPTPDSKQILSHSPKQHHEQQQQQQQQHLTSSSQPPSLTTTVANNDETKFNDNTSSDNKLTKRKSLSDVVTLQANSTHSSIKHDLSKKHQIDCSSTKPVVSNANVMSRLSSNMTTSANGLSDAVGSSTTVSTAAAVAASNTQEHLQPPSNVPVNLSSNSSLNSSSVKSIASKSNDGTSTEKKRKLLSSSRQKKFHRRFKQVDMDEEVINYFSCAFVSDILLQGYLYITKNYIAFYSNVFGYVTKLLIPVTSVVRISKEKTVKIFPNAIAVATIDERHVFSSFLSREAAYQLMISVWKEALPMCDIDVTTAAAQLRIPEKNGNISCDTTSNSKFVADSTIFKKVSASTLQVHQHRKTSNSGVSEIDDESSSAISGSEGLVKLLQSQKPLLGSEIAQLNATNSSSSSNSNSNSNSNPSACDFTISGELNSDLDASKCLIEAKSLTSTPKTDGSSDKLKSAFNEISTISFLKFRIPRTIHIAYFGLSLVIILVLLAGFLFYRISEMKNAHLVRMFSIDDLNAEPPNVNRYAEVLKWQKDMQAQKVHLTKNVLANNLEQISQISDSLQTLSSLIHSNVENHDNDDRISTVIGECDSLEACILEQDSKQP